MNIPQVHKLSRASQFSLLAIVILLGGVYFTVNSALQQQNKAGHANITTYSSIFLRSSTHNSNGGVSHITLSVPGSKVAGDVLIAQVVVHGASTSITPPTGWSLIRRDTTATSLASALYKRVASGVDAPTYTWSFGSVQYAAGGIVDLAHVDTSNPVDASSGKYNYMTETMTASSISTTTNVDELLFFGAVDGIASVTPPSDMTAGFTQTSAKTTAFLAHLKLSSSGSTGNKTATGNIDVSNVSQLIALKPASIIIVPNTPVPTVKPTLVPTKGPTATPKPTHVPTPTCTPRPICNPGQCTLPVPPPGGWCSVSPTPLPSNSPTISPTSVPVPTDTPAPGSTVIAVKVGLHGIGTAGDSASPGSQGNMHPLHPSRTITADVYDSQNQLVVSQQGTIIFDASTGIFGGTVDLGTGFSSGLYTVKIKTDQYLRALVPGIQNITSGQTNTLPEVILVDGDINNDNAINIEDYNILIGCYSDLLPPTNCPAGQDVASDITDDGHVNQFDYNLFLRELTNIGGQ